jgi:hypothetical protein
MQFHAICPSSNSKAPHRNSTAGVRFPAYVNRHMDRDLAFQFPDTQAHRSTLRCGGSNPASDTIDLSSPSHGENRGSSPLGSANKINNLLTSPLLARSSYGKYTE